MWREILSAFKQSDKFCLCKKVWLHPPQSNAVTKEQCYESQVCNAEISVLIRLFCLFIYILIFRVLSVVRLL
jgi:hypothetical protein